MLGEAGEVLRSTMEVRDAVSVSASHVLGALLETPITNGPIFRVWYHAPQIDLRVGLYISSKPCLQTSAPI